MNWELKKEAQITLTAQSFDPPSSFPGPPSEPAGVYAIQSSIGTSSLRLSWTVGASNGENILFHTVEALPVMLNEWYTAVDRKFSYINKNHCDRNVFF